MEKATPEISVIVAVYNSKEYIDKCMDSILHQTMEDFEVILVDDGSTDGSGDICDAYALRDSRVRVFHKSNEGVSATRQTGIDNMKGKYSIHIDPDDWIEPDMLETLHRIATESDADVSVCGMSFEYDNHTESRPQNFEEYSKERLIDSIFDLSFFPSLCNKLIRNEIYSRYGITIPCNISLGEDMLVCLQLALCGCSFAYTYRILYHYDKHSNQSSLSNNVFTTKYFEEFSETYPSLMETFRRQNGIRTLNRFGTMTAHKAFYYADISSINGIRLFFKHIPMFINSDGPFHRKLNLLMSAIGFAPIVKSFYKKLKGAYVQ